MKKILTAVVLITFAHSPPHAASQFSDSLVLRLMNEYDVPGLSLSIVHGDSVSSYAWGYADVERTRAVTADTPFRIASVAKVLVAATAAVEVSKDRIGFHDDVSDLLCEDSHFTGPVTLHDLLTHTAGFDERLVGYGAQSSGEMIPLGDYLIDRMPTRGWPVGENISYSNHGIALAAYALERARGLSFAEVAQLNVFSPLGMRSTEFLTRGNGVPPKSATPLSCGEGICVQVPHYFSHAYPAGLLFSTAQDMGRFIAGMLAAEEDGMPFAELIPERYTHDKRLPGMSYGFFNQSHNGRRFLSHAGSVPGFWSLLMISPEADLGFFFVTNGGASEFGERLRDELLRTFFGEEVLSPPMPSISEDPSLRSGTYESTRYSHDTIERFPQVFHNSIEVIAKADTLVILSGRRSTKYIQVDNALYESLDGADKIAFGSSGGKARMFRSSLIYGAGLPVAYEKRPWYLTPRFLNEYASWIIGAPIILLFILWPISLGVGVVLSKRRGDTRRLSSKKAKFAWWLAAITTASFSVFGFGFIARSNLMLESGELFFGVPDTLMVLAWIPIMHAILVVMALIVLVVALKEAWWDLARRVLYLLTVIIFALQVHFLIQWNYLPIAW